MQFSTWEWVHWIRMNNHACYAAWHFRLMTGTPTLGCHDCKLTGAVLFGGAARVGSARLAAVYIKASIIVSTEKLGESVARLIWFSFPTCVVLLMSQANCICNRPSSNLYCWNCTFSRVSYSCPYHVMWCWKQSIFGLSAALLLMAEMQYDPSWDHDVLQLDMWNLRTACPRGWSFQSGAQQHVQRWTHCLQFWLHGLFLPQIGQSLQVWPLPLPLHATHQSNIELDYTRLI